MYTSLENSFSISKKFLFDLFVKRAVLIHKIEVDVDGLRSSFAGIQLQHPAERHLALGLLQFSEALDQVLDDYRPNQLTNYLFDVAKRFSTFFQECPVLRAEDEAVRLSRLLLCDVTARVIAQGLELLGIGVVDRM